MPLNELQRCPALSELAKIQASAQEMAHIWKICICLAMQNWIKSEEMLETGKEIASVFQISGLCKCKDMEEHYCNPQVTASNQEHLQHVFVSVRRKFSL